MTGPDHALPPIPPTPHRAAMKPLAFGPFFPPGAQAHCRHTSMLGHRYVFMFSTPSGRPPQAALPLGARRMSVRLQVASESSPGAGRCCPAAGPSSVFSPSVCRGMSPQLPLHRLGLPRIVTRVAQRPRKATGLCRASSAERRRDSRPARKFPGCRPEERRRAHHSSFDEPSAGRVAFSSSTSTREHKKKDLHT